MREKIQPRCDRENGEQRVARFILTILQPFTSFGQMVDALFVSPRRTSLSGPDQTFRFSYFTHELYTIKYSS